MKNLSKFCNSKPRIVFRPFITILTKRININITSLYSKPAFSFHLSFARERVKTHSLNSNGSASNTTPHCRQFPQAKGWLDLSQL
jgi:hypothetical protein